MFLTYLASEYLVADNQHTPPWKEKGSVGSLLGNGGRLPYLLLGGTAVFLVNLLDRVSGAKEVVNQALEGFLHLPRILFVSIAYILALYLDVKRRAPLLNLRLFGTRVGLAFLKVLPAYPFLAVLISFVFMFVINIWENLHLPMELLNAPIYYGTLYGPFAWVYVHVKKEILSELTSLPV